MASATPTAIAVNAADLARLEEIVLANRPLPAAVQAVPEPVSLAGLCVALSFVAYRSANASTADQPLSDRGNALTNCVRKRSDTEVACRSRDLSWNVSSALRSEALRSWNCWW